MSGSKQWAWYAGDCEDEFDLAGPCTSREAAIDEAYGSHLEPGDTIFLIEAISDDQPDENDRVGFISWRNRSSVIREED